VLNPALAVLTQPSEEQQRRIDCHEEKLKEYYINEGLAKAQIVMVVSESMALRLGASPTAKAMWDTLVTEIMKKLQMVLTKLQRELHMIRCTEDDDLCVHLDKALDLHACLNEMGAQISKVEFMHIILASIPPSYESTMDALTTSLKECGKPVKPENIIRVLKTQYDKRKAYGSSRDNDVFVSKQVQGSSKDNKAHICANCKKKGHTKEQCWSKGGGQEGQGPKQC
jgi:hypothetical protein